MGHHRVRCAPSCPQRPGLGHWGTWMSPSQQAWGSCRRRQQKDKQGPPLEWGSFAALPEMAARASTPMEWCVVAAAVLSTVMGLRISKGSDSQTTSMGWQEESSSGTKKSTTNGTPGPSVIMGPPRPWCYTTQRQKSWDAHQTNSISFGPDSLNASWRNSCSIPRTKRCDGMDGDGYVQQP